MSEVQLVSVIIPARNAAAHIRRTIQSALLQSYRNLEVLVVDDGSQDATPEIVQEIANNDSRVILLRQKHAGVAAARNLAIEASQGDFIAPLDADDVWFRQKIEKQVLCLASGPESAGLAYSWWVSVDGSGRILNAGPRWSLQGSLLEPLIVTNFIGNASVPLIRRTCIEEVGGYTSHIQCDGAQGCEDWDLALRVAARYEFRLVPEYLVGYRRLRESMSRSGGRMSGSYDLVFDALIERHGEIPSALLRWSRSRFYAYLASLNSDDEQSLTWMWKAFAADPALCLSTRMVRRLLRRLMGVGSTPLHYYPRVTEESKQLDEIELVLDLNGLPRSAGHDPFPSTWKPYPRLSRWRWNKMMDSSRLNRVR